MVETGENSNYLDIESLMSRTFIFVVEVRNGKLDSAVTRPNGLIMNKNLFVTMKWGRVLNPASIGPAYYTELFDKRT